jgi:hypothetical protein
MILLGLILTRHLHPHAQWMGPTSNSSQWVGPPKPTMSLSFVKDCRVRSLSVSERKASLKEC